ncbi:MAG: DUF1934 family protein [Clostridiales bacterium]|nr:DUF1934 family protein [Clostridiales bacterium]
MRRDIEIITEAYDQPHRTGAVINDTGSNLVIRWKQLHEGDSKETLYEIDMDKKTGVAAIKRSGEIRSEMTFDTVKRTKGFFHTAYGVIEMDIETEYINMPSVLSEKFEISYRLLNGEDIQKNVFTVKFL